MRAMIFLAGVAMAGSFFLTWLEMPFAGPNLSPWGLVQEGGLRPTAEAAWQVWVFLGGFGLAGLAALSGSGVAAALAGLSAPVAVIGSLSRLEAIRRDLGLPFRIDLRDTDLLLDIAADFLRLGVWAYAGGAVVLLVAGLTVIASPRR
jgi:hypothetical protein